MCNVPCNTFEKNEVAVPENILLADPGFNVSKTVGSADKIGQ